MKPWWCPGTRDEDVTTGRAVGVPSYDFSGCRVLLTGGTRGLGLQVARAFAEAGGQVTVTGTASLVSYYDPEVARFAYQQVDLTDAEEIAALAGRLAHVDVLVNAATARLSVVVDDEEREFLAQAARLGLLGPLQLATRLRHRMATSEVRGGGAVVNLPTTRGWFALSRAGGDGVSPDAELERTTQRLGSTWGRLGVRLNTVTAPVTVPAPRPSVLPPRVPGAGPLLTRRADPRTALHRQILDLTLFLASEGAAGLTGLSLPVGATRSAD